MDLEVKVLTLISAMIARWYIVQAESWLNRYSGCNLSLPPDAITTTFIVQTNNDCTYLIAPFNGCCSIYDSVTNNCTIVRIDRFHLVNNTSDSFEVGILSKLT